MTLEPQTALAVNPDYDRQVQIWDAIMSSRNKEPYQIQRMLAGTSVRTSGRRALLDRLVSEQIVAEAEAIAAAG